MSPTRSSRRSTATCSTTRPATRAVHERLAASSTFRDQMVDAALPIKSRAVAACKLPGAARRATLAAARSGRRDKPGGYADVIQRSRRQSCSEGVRERTACAQHPLHGWDSGRCAQNRERPLVCVLAHAVVCGAFTDGKTRASRARRPTSTRRGMQLAVKLPVHCG
jgi:hypothetical protein